MPDHKYTVFTLKNIPAPNFVMTPLELKDYLGFEVKRVYFITSPSGLFATGNHAHRELEDELFIQIQGSSTICVDDGSGMSEIKLAGPKSAINVPHMTWHGFKDLSPDCIILALTNTNYDPSRADYIENYAEFQALCQKNLSS